MKTIIELTIALLLSVLANCTLIVYEMLKGQGILIYNYSQHFILCHVVFVFTCGVLLYILFERKKSSLNPVNIIVSIFVLGAIMVLMVILSPYYENDTLIFNNLEKPVTWMWMHINNNVDAETINKGISGIFVKYILIDDLKIIVPFLIVITAKFLSIISFGSKKILKHTV